MNKISRRKLITTGVAATAGVAGLAAASRIARRYGLVPPDGHQGFFGPGETLTYASQRILTRHSLAREFPRSMISEKPFGNEVAPPAMYSSATRPLAFPIGTLRSKAWSHIPLRFRWPT